MWDGTDKKIKGFRQKSEVVGICSSTGGDRKKMERPGNRSFRTQVDLYPVGGGHEGLRYCGIGLFFMGYFGNFNFHVRYCGII